MHSVQIVLSAGGGDLPAAEPLRALQAQRAAGEHPVRRRRGMNICSVIIYIYIYIYIHIYIYMYSSNNS